MGSSTIIGVVVTIIVVAIILYMVSYFMRKKNQEKLDILEKRKEALFDLPVMEEVDTVKKMHLVGQSQNTFRDWSRNWSDISNKEFAELESQIFEAENLNETFRFLQAKTAVKEAEATLANMEDQVKDIRDGLRELRESEERNSLAVQKALDVYEELKKDLRENDEEYGPAHSELQKQLKNIEIDFTQFVTLNTSGDPVEAREVLATAEKHTYSLEELMKRVPKAYETLAKTFPEQLKEIKDGYKKMLDDKYVFPEENFKNDFNQVEKNISRALNDLAKTEMEAVELISRDTADDIDVLYALLEREIDAKQFVVKNRPVMEEYINHATRNNRQLLIELDHISQSYALNHNELGRVRGFQTEIEELARRNENYNPQIDRHEVAYSEVQTFYKNSFKILDDLEKEQVDIDNSLRDLRKGEKDAQEKVEKFEFELRNLKRFVEKQRLPGIPKAYLDFFFVVTNRVEDLNKALNKIRINIDEVEELTTIAQDDLNVLEEQTHELVDAAALTEQMLQYANRYRHSHPEIKASIDRTVELFNKDYRYQEALDEIGTALERIEPGAFKRIETFYFNNRDLV